MARCWWDYALHSREGRSELAPDLYGIEKFTYVPEENCYLCPAGKPLNYVGINKRNRAHRYYSTVKRCRGCGQKPQCTRGKFRTIAIHTCEAARQKADEVAKTPEFAVALRKRRKVKALFSELKNLIGLRRLRLRRIKFVREQFYLSCCGTEPETTGAVPQHESATSDGKRVSNHYQKKTRIGRNSPEGKRVFEASFSTPTRFFTNYRPKRHPSALHSLTCPATRPKIPAQ